MIHIHDEDSLKIIEWLKDRPENSNVVWTSDHFTLEFPFTGSWVDVMLPEFVDSGMSWVFTIVHYGDEDLEHDDCSSWCFPYATDKVAHGFWNPETFWYDNEVVLDNGQEPSPDLIAHLTDRVEKANHENAKLTERNGWSTAQISEALSWWAETYAERSDLLFVWNPHGEKSDLLRLAEERYAEYISLEDDE